MDQEAEVTESAQAGMGRLGQGFLQALVVALNGLEQEADTEAALSASFKSATEALGAERALLARVSADGTIAEVLVAEGLTSSQVDALCQGTSVRGVSATVVRQALKSGDVELVEDARQREGADLTMALRGEDFSVLCAALRDPYTGVVRAVVYWQSVSYARPYTEADLPWVSAYARALAGVLHLWESGERRVAVAHAGVATGGGCVLIGDSPSTRHLREELNRVYLPMTERAHPEPILVLGESGTGKDLVARYLHTFSQRRSRQAFVAENCALIRGTVEARLLGHVKGSYTDAVADGPGLFRMAHEGVLFLDEVGDLPPEGQAALLRVIETRMVRAFGGTKETPVDVQIVLATNKDLRQMIEERLFREDLFQRFQGLTVRLQPLRERPEDVHPLLSHLLRAAEERHGKVIDGLAPEVWALLLAHDWRRGNVREMASLCSALVLRTPHRETVTEEILKSASPEIHGQAVGRRTGQVAGEAALLSTRLDQVVGDFERSYLKQCLLAAQRQKKSLGAMAEGLGVSRTTLYRRLFAYGLNTDDIDAGAGES